MVKNRFFSLFFAFIVIFSTCITCTPTSAAESPPPQINKVFQSQFFVMTENGYSAAHKSTVIDSQEAKALQATFNRCFKNDLVGILLSEYTPHFAIKPASGVQPTAMTYSPETRTYRVLKLNKVDAHGFWIFDIPAGTSTPMRIVVSSGALVRGAKRVSNPGGADAQRASDPDDADSIDGPGGYIPRPDPDPIVPPAGFTPDSPFLNPDDLSGGEMTRQEWISRLVEKARLSMYNTNTSSSFTDVDEENIFSWAIEIALQNGAIALSGDEERRFYPQRAATEAFAVVSAVRALGFNYGDLTDCYAIANDSGIFTGTPSTRNLSSSQAGSILQTVARIAEPANIDPDAAQTVNYGEDTVALSEASLDGDYTFDSAAGEGSALLSIGATGNVQAGDCIILPPTAQFPGGLAQKIENVQPQSDGSTLLTTSTPTLDEIMGDGEISVQGTAEADASRFIINDELAQTYNVAYAARRSTLGDSGMTLGNSGISRLSARSRPSINITGDYIEVSFSERLGDRVNANGNAKLYFPDVEYKVDLDWILGIPVRVNELRFALTNKAKCEGEFEVVGSKNDIFDGVELGRVPIPLGPSGFTVDIVLFIGLSAKGSISVAYELQSTAGIQYVDGHLRTIHQCRSNVDFTPLEAEVEFGPSLSAMLTLFSVFDLADVTASAGLGVNASATFRDSENVCIDGTAYIYSRLTALKNSLVGKLLHVSFSKTIWDKSNSGWKKSMHFEGTPTDVGFVPECTFGEGKIVGSVKDAATGGPINFFSVTARKTDGEGSAHDFSGVVSMNGSFNIDDLPAGAYRITISAPDYRTYVKENARVRKDQTNNLGVIRLVSANAAEGSAGGYVTDSQTGGPIDGATVALYYSDGTASPTGQTVLTGSDGAYRFSATATGNYTIVVSRSGYSSGSRSIVVTESGAMNQNVTLVPIGSGGDYDTSVDVGTYTQIGDLRVVLTWGQTPSDLDSHLCGPTYSGSDRFHIYYADRYYQANQKTHAFLDHDDVTSYGPETTTVYDINTSGKYSFYVHDYTNGGSAGSYALSESDATVQVYVKEATGGVNENGEALYRAKLVRTFYVPSVTPGTLWHVFDYNAATGQLTARNTMTVDTGPGNVGNRSALRPDEEADMDAEDRIDIGHISDHIKNRK